MFTALARTTSKGNLIPPVPLVGVEYEVPCEEYYRRRERDFTPTAALLDDFPNAGRGEYFARVLRRELVPFVESTCRVDPENRTIKRLKEILEGRSYEGLDYRVKLFPEETHRTVFPIAVSRGLRFMLSKGGWRARAGEGAVRAAEMNV